MSELAIPAASPFDALRREDEAGEHWSAREIQPLLGYTVWRDFLNAIKRAQLTCQNSGQDPVLHFADVRKVAGSGPAAIDFRLSRYACYLIGMNGDPRKLEVAAAQTYFAVKTREAEVADNARAAEQESPALALTRGRLSLLQAAVGLVDPAWLEAKTRHELARGLGEAPEVDPATRPLTVGEYLQQQGVTGAELRSMSSMFGKLVKKRYRTEYGDDPKPTERFVDGALREVAGYTEQHRGLFDATWNAMTGGGAA